ncbi:MAG: maiA [Myxococcaceae bacterium]|nr:maiA [Myxococcaceae bacterium]
MKLYQGWNSSASWRVRWALALKDVAYESVWLDIAAGEHREALAHVNPLLTVPTLVFDEGDSLGESVAIVEWLEESYPKRRLLPANPKQRALVRELVQLVNADTHPLQNTLVRKSISEDEREQNQWSARWIERGLGAYEAHLALSGSRFSVGDTLSMADLFLVPQVVNARRFGADISGYKRVLDVFDRCMETPEAVATHPEQAIREARFARGHAR